MSNRQLRVALALIVGLTLFSAFTTWGYFTKRIDLAELERVREENAELRSVNQSFEVSIRSLQGQLSEFEDRTRQLAIVAGLEALGDAEESGIGGDEVAGVGLDFLESRTLSLDDELDRVSEQLEEQRQWVSSVPAISPVKGILTSGFGYRSDPITGRRAPHWAVDISTAPGRSVRASADGIVVRAGRIGQLGNAVYISHGYGVTTRYGHLSSISATPGQRVRRGDAIGTVGRSGRATGNHLHYEVRVDGKPENPLAYILDGVRGS